MGLLTGLGETFAALPAPGGYFAWWKLLIMAALLFPWLSLAGYLDKDLRNLNFPRFFWNTIIFFGGVAGLALWFIVPFFFLGLLIYAVSTSCVVFLYVYWRNGKVSDENKILTISHLSDILSSRRPEGQTGPRHSKIVERVQLSRSTGETVLIPDDVDERTAYRTLQDILFDAISKRASLVRLSAKPPAGTLSYRIDGITNQRDMIPKEEAENFIDLMKKICRLDSDNLESRSAGLNAKLGLTDFHLEVGASTTKTRDPQIQIRIIAEDKSFKIEDLGFRPDQRESLEAILHSPRSGIVLVCGMPGSGVTTSLYAIARSFDPFLNNIQTIETERLMDLEAVSQHIWGAEEEKNYPETVRTLLLKNPSVLAVDRCDDAETAKAILNGGARGAKLFVGVEAPNVFKGLASWVRWSGDVQATADHLLAITAQTLVRRLCLKCKQPYRPDPQMLKNAGLPPDKIQQFFRPPAGPILDENSRPVVCSRCNGNGYFGLTGVFEMLVVNDAMQSLLHNGAAMEQIMRQARKDKTLTLQEESFRRVIDGETSITEILRSTRKGDDVN